MEYLLYGLFGNIFGVIFYILVIVLFVKVSALKRRVSELEATLKNTPHVARSPQPPSTQVTPAIGVAQQELATPPSSPAYILEKESAFFLWLKEDSLLKLGALIVFIGCVWLVSYAFLNNWIGPMGRITLGLVFGAGLIAFGWMRMQKYAKQGSIFLVLGSSTVILTIFSARILYDFFSPVLALSLMFLTTIVVTLAALRFSMRSLAITGLALSVLVPLFVHSPAPNYIGLNWYLMVVACGTLWVVWRTGWRVLTLEMLVAVLLYSLPHLQAFFPLADRGVLLLFAYAFTGLFFIANTLGLIHSRLKEEIRTDLITAVLNSVFLLGWIRVAVASEWQSLTIVTWAIVFAVGAFLFYVRTADRKPFFVYAGIGTVLLAVATALECSGAVLTIAYTMEAAVLSLLAYRLSRNLSMAETLGFILIGPAVLGLESIFSSAWNTGVLHEDFFVLFLLVLVMGGVGFYYLHERWKNGLALYSPSSRTLIILSGIYAAVLVWLSLHSAIDDQDIATMLSLIVFTVIGIFAFLSGRNGGNVVLRGAGIALLVFVIGRLFVIDVWKMELSGRIITFFIIGALLMSTAFMRKKLSKPKHE